jgi:molecular chaperone DnaK (HSP70)
MLIEEGKKIENKKISILLRKTDFEKSCKEFFAKINNLIKNILNQAKLSEMDIDDIILIGETTKSPKIKLILYDIFKNNAKISKILLQSDSNSSNKEIFKDNLISIGCALQLMNNRNLLTSKYLFTDISPYSFGIETLDGLMDIIIQKGKKLPYKNKKIIRINNKGEKICVNIFEGEDMYVKNNIFITCASFDKSNFKGNSDSNYTEVLIQLEIDCSYNLKCHIIDPKTNNRFECLININYV